MALANHNNFKGITAILGHWCGYVEMIHRNQDSNISFSVMQISLSNFAIVDLFYFFSLELDTQKTLLHKIVKILKDYSVASTKAPPSVSETKWGLVGALLGL